MGGVTDCVLGIDHIRGLLPDYVGRWFPTWSPHNSVSVEVTIIIFVNIAFITSKTNLPIAFLFIFADTSLKCITSNAGRGPGFF